MGHVYAYLMGTAGLKHTFDQSDMHKVFQYFIVRDCMFTRRVIWGQYGHLKSVLGIAAYVALYAAGSRGGNTPYQRVIFTLGGLVEKLFAEMCFRVGCFSYNEQAGCVFVNSVYKSETRV